VLSAADEVRSGKTVELELKDVPTVMPDREGANGESPIDASVRPAPTAAIICGLSGLLEELAKLPFLECCMPWTMLVWR
jgi:hypothetical protein